MTWAEYSAWLTVTDRIERRHRAASVLDSAHAFGGGDPLKAHLEALDGE